MTGFDIYFQALGILLVVAIFFWIISIAIKDVSIVDSLWSLFFLIAGIYTYSQLETPSLRAQIVLILVIIWSLRLSAYITIRHWGHSEDHRYQTIRANNQPGFSFKSIYLIFIFQAVIAWIVALPLFYAMNSTLAFGIFDWIGIGLWLTGMYFESTADTQLWIFKRNPDNQGKVMSSGLWKYSRHPNYFGEFLIWWGYFCFALAGASYLSIISPLIMTFLLMKFSGVGLLEKTMKRRPGYESYIQSTNAFFPGPRRKVKES